MPTGRGVTFHILRYKGLCDIHIMTIIKQIKFVTACPDGHYSAMLSLFYRKLQY